MNKHFQQTTYSNLILRCKEENFYVDIGFMIHHSTTIKSKYMSGFNESVERKEIEIIELDEMCPDLTPTILNKILERLYMICVLRPRKESFWGWIEVAHYLGLTRILRTIENLKPQILKPPISIQDIQKTQLYLEKEDYQKIIKSYISHIKPSNMDEFLKLNDQSQIKQDILWFAMIKSFKDTPNKIETTTVEESSDSENSDY